MNYSMPKYFQNMPQVGNLLANIDEANENAVKKLKQQLLIVLQQCKIQELLMKKFMIKVK